MHSTSLEAVIREIVREEIARTTNANAPARGHSQSDGERPTGVGRARYLRGWARGHKAGDPEVWADGRARCMSANAWARHGAAPRSKTAKVPCAPRSQAVELRSDVLAEIGLDARRAG